MAKQEFSIAKLANLMITEDDAYRLLEELRWGGDPTVCPKCSTADGKLYFPSGPEIDRDRLVGRLGRVRTRNAEYGSAVRAAGSFRC
jgi:hypothetical protein